MYPSNKLIAYSDVSLLMSQFLKHDGAVMHKTVRVQCFIDNLQQQKQARKIVARSLSIQPFNGVTSWLLRIGPLPEQR